MQNLRLVTIWERKRASNSHVKYHNHKYHELVYYASGNGKTQIGSKAFSFSEHRFAVIPQSTEHNEIHNTDSEVICLGFFSTDNLPFGFYTDTNNTIYKILKELLNEAKSQKYGYADMLAIKLNELLLHIFRIENNTATTKNFAYVINYIRDNYHEHIDLSNCAKQLNLSYDYFQHKFKAITGYSPQQFLMEQRLLASQKMLKEGNYNCTEIAYRCGFCTSAQFSAIFKKRYAVTPLQFKNQHQKA